MPEELTAPSTEKDESPDEPKYEPGVLCSVEISPHEPVDLAPSEIGIVHKLLTDINQRDMAARREEVLESWKAHLFDRGSQRLLPVYGGGWEFPAEGSGANVNDVAGEAMFTVDMYGSYEQTCSAALSREVPTPRWVPVDPENDADITAAEAAERLKPHIEQNNKMHGMMADIGRLLWVDSRGLLHTGYELDGQQFGYEEDETEVVPEDEEKTSEQESTETGMEPGSQEPSEKPQSEAEGSSQAERSGPTKRQPKGREVIRIFNVLESKLPIKANCLSECDYIRVSKEIDISLAKAMYPDKADKIISATGGPAGDDIDRLARINVNLGVRSTVLTADSQVWDATWERTWIRPSMFMGIEDVPTREKFIKEFPDGVRITYMGNAFIEARPENIDDHFTLIHAVKGDGMHRKSLGSAYLPLQEVVNELAALAYQYFVKGVPRIWLEAETFSVKALAGERVSPGDYKPFALPEGVAAGQLAISDYAFIEPVATIPPALIEFMQEITTGDLAQFLTGIFPALFGGQDASATDTLGGMEIQRDQALARIGMPWNHIKEGIARVFQQAVQCIARNSKADAINIPGNESVRIELADLKGRYMAYADPDENFPESPTQIQNRIDALITEAATNPMIAALLDDPANINIIKQGTPIKGLKYPKAEANNKQLGEIDVMLKTGPVPNPMIAEIEQELQTLEMELREHPDPATIQQGAQHAQILEQELQQLQQTQPLVSSVDIRYFDDHETELLTVKSFLNDDRGRRLANGNEQEQAAYKNIELHGQAHEKADGEKKAAMQKQAMEANQKPVGVSANVKDMPPVEAAEALNKAGISAQPQDFTAQDAVEAAEKHPKDVSVKV